MELPLWAELVWRTVDGVEKDQEPVFRRRQNECREEGLEEEMKHL